MSDVDSGPGAPGVAGPLWRVMGATVRGSAHVRAGRPNEDAIGWWPESGEGPPVILTVSDGHGSAKCFRSEIGARLAVETAMAVLRDFVRERPADADLSGIKRTLEDRVPREVVRRWAEKVRRHLEENPESTAEAVTLAQLEGDEVADEVLRGNKLLFYGATLLACVVADSYVAYLQLGDGDIVVVSEAGEVERPLPRDERLIANQTTSLSSPNAWQEVRLAFRPLSPSSARPALVLLSSDGYANSFRDQQGFLQVGADILDMMRADGVDSVKNGLEGWLAEATRAGSGDDITLGVLYRLTAVGVDARAPAPAPIPVSSSEGEDTARGVGETHGDGGAPR